LAERSIVAAFPPSIRGSPHFRDIRSDVSQPHPSRMLLVAIRHWAGL